MMKTLWIAPNDIADLWTVNNRKENPGHIESLAESMRQNGYLPEYPIIAFEAVNIPINTDKPYLVACGHHRRKAAIAAEIDLIFTEVHDGTEEEWIEMMSLTTSSSMLPRTPASDSHSPSKSDAPPVSNSFCSRNICGKPTSPSLAHGKSVRAPSAAGANRWNR